MTQWQYKQVEAALAAIVDTRPVKSASIRTRLGRLRKIGIPKIKNPGSGRKIEYEWGHALELMVALELQALGLNPKIITILIETYLRPCRHYRSENVKADERGDMFITFRPWFGNHPEAQVFFAGRGFLVGSAQLNTEINMHEKAVGMLNISSCARYLSHALKQQTAN